MHKWHLLLFAFLAVCKPTVNFGEHNLADGQQQCCNRHSSFLLRDTRLSLHDSNRYVKSVDEDRRRNLKALREIRQYDQKPRQHSVAKITAKDKHVNLISLQLIGRNIQQSFKNTKGKGNYEIARESIFGVYGSRQNQNQGTRLAVYYNRDSHRSHSSTPQEVRDVTHNLLQGARNDAARSSKNMQRTIEYKVNYLRSVKRSEPRFDTNRESRVNSRKSRDIRETTETRELQGARKGIVQSYRKLQFMIENRMHGMRRVKRSDPRFNINHKHRANSRISRDVRGTTETRDQVTRDDVARPYSNAQRTVEYTLDRLRRVARSEPRLDTTRESRVNSRISRDFGETTEIRDQRARNVVRSYRKVQLNVENRVNNFRSDTSFEPRFNTIREHRKDSRIAQDLSKTAETRNYEARNDVVRSYRNVPLMVENRIASVIQVTRSEPRFHINNNRSSLKYSRVVTGPKETRDLLQARNVIIRSHKNIPRTVKSTLNGLRRVSRSETRIEDNRERRIRAVRVFENESEHPITYIGNTISRNRNFAEMLYYRANSQHHIFRTEAREKSQEERQQTFFEQRVQHLSQSVLKIDNNRILSRYDNENLWKLSNGRIDEQRHQREENTIRARQEVSQRFKNRRSIRSPVILRNRLRIISKERRNHQIQQYRDENSNQPTSLKQTQYIVYLRPVLLDFNTVQTRVGSSNIRAKTERIQERSPQESESNDDKERPSDGRMKITANIYRRPSLSGGPNRVLYSNERSANIRSGPRQQNNLRIYGNRQFSNNGRVQRFRNVRSKTDDDRRSLSVNPNPILNRAPNVRKLENITAKYNRKSNKDAKNNKRVHYSELTNRNVILQNDAGRWNVRNSLKNEAINNGHRRIGYTERSFETRGSVRNENRQDQRSREHTSSDYRHNMRQTLLQERGVQVRNTLATKAGDVQLYNDHASEIKKQKEYPKKETATVNWQYIFYTIQGLYVCAILIHIGIEDKLRKTKKGYLGLWKSSQDTLKVE